MSVPVAQDQQSLFHGRRDQGKEKIERRAFDGEVAVGDEPWRGEHAEEGGGAVGAEGEGGDGDTRGGAQHPVPLPVDHHAGDDGSSTAARRQKLLGERRLERRLAGGVEPDHLLHHVGAGDDVGGEGLADGHEGEVPVARRVRRVEVGVEHGDAQPPRAEELPELEHLGDVAPEREREHHDAAAGGSGSTSVVAGHRCCCWWCWISWLGLLSEKDWCRLMTLRHWLGFMARLARCYIGNWHAALRGM